MYKSPKILLSGDSALTVEFADEISEEVNLAIRKYVQVLQQYKIPGITELIPTFRSVLIQYDPRFLTYDHLVEMLEKLYEEQGEMEKGSKKVIEIPVCYDGEFGPDLEFVAANAGISCEEVIEIHTSKEYLIYMLGFLPGFAYLGGLDERIYTPRLATPRIKIPAGSVGIGGEQTGLYPLESPGGWQIIGTTPVRSYAPDQAPPIPYEAGDYIKFYRISEEEFYAIAKEDKDMLYR